MPSIHISEFTLPLSLFPPTVGSMVVGQPGSEIVLFSKCCYFFGFVCTLERASPDSERSKCSQTLSVINNNDSDAAQARTTLLVHNYGGKPAQSPNPRPLSALWATGGDLRIFTDSWT